jgi:predicted AlkP superfamily phosphohydrolase/phosphomutase
MEKYEWDFFMTHFYFLDQVQHFLWKYMDSKHPLYDSELAKKYGDSILKYYQKIDSTIGEFLDKKDQNTTLFIMSDHGFGPLHKRVYINHWLRKIGLLKLKESKNLAPKGWFSKLGLTRDGISNLVEKFNFLKLGMKIIPRVVVRQFYWAVPRSTLTLQDIDFRQTKAYSTGYVGQIFINLKGRDPEGIVESGKEYEKLRQYISKQLLELVDPETGEKLVDNVIKKEEIYSGKYLEQAADLLFTMKNMSYITQGTVGTSWEFGPDLDSFTSNPDSLNGWHRMNGVFIGTGSSLKTNAKIDQARIIDLAPTILHMYNIPIPSDMDGHVLKAIFDLSSNLSKKEIKYQKYKKYERKNDSITENDKEEVKKRLKALGYLD